MADIFLKIDGIQGESQEVGHVGEVEITSWAWKMHSDGRYLTGSGAGKATVEDMELTHMIDAASPNFMRYFLPGSAIPKAIITMRKAGTVPLDFHKFTLENVRITGVNPIGSDGTYIERVTLSFTKVKQEYLLQTAAGIKGGAITATFDLRENREV
ncbi:Hcp family type VI secretion system effector [Caballeronia grimmiae]|uniref:Hcp1 family type VI secretion system effector n=1 Tax=Caballeronia grimmiae TaxID=1071679 RepID=A0A069P7T6_9BURK|nr:type VI secretion system tube protein Hcp [Caballeronia grimmiae]KDR36700.1 Hcp1 family type VI secretion system effector [Caballeronia grimmiae]GGD78400.1 hypothetical protein GCM10010985_36100 [Caballeronia grimmiae]